VYAAGSTGAVEGNTLSGNLYAGAWLQGGAGGAAGLAVEDNVLDGNHEVAVGVLGDTRASVRDNEVRGTIPGVAIEGGATVVFAYGVALLGGGAASVTGNRFGAFAPAEGARTAHVLVDHGAAGIEVKTNSPDAAADAVRIVVQNQAAESPVTIVGNAGAAAVEYPPAQPYHLSDPMTDGIGMIGPGGGPPE
jgi:hypothetical protein